MANPNAKPPKGKGFKPGVSGNPKGRPKKPDAEKAAVKHVKEAIWTAATSTMAQLERKWKNPTFGQKIAMKMVVRAGEHGNIPAIKEFNDRLLGRAPQEITGADGESLIPQGVEIAALATLDKAALLALIGATD